MANGELLTQAAARQLLERAGQIDSDNTSVETLRAAAREAGISEAAFEAALIEMRSKAASPPPAPPRSRARLLATIGAAAVILTVAMASYIIPRTVGTAQAELMIDHDVPVECLPMKVAQDIAQTLLRSQGNEVQMSKGSRVLRVRANAEQMRMLTKTFQETARGLSSCDNTPP